MSQPSLLSPAHQSPKTSSRLVRFLAELLDTDAQVSHQRFIERLGKSFDLADSIKISAVHDKTFDATVKAPAAGKQAVRDEFERVRASILHSATQSFISKADSIRLRFPMVSAAMTHDEAMDPEPYLAFYVAQQRNIDFRIRELHASTRSALTELSPQLARLAALDAVVSGPLSVTFRRVFNAVPRLLRQRFESLSIELQTNEPEHCHEGEIRDQILRQFRDETHGLLLAEIETRLLPTLGLIHALDEKHDD